jgi:hypothetical protein
MSKVRVLFIVIVLFLIPGFTLLVQAMEEDKTCIVLPNWRSGLPCNPAALAYLSRYQLRAHVALTDNADMAGRTNDWLAGVRIETLAATLDRNHHSEGSRGFGLSYFEPKFGVQIDPGSVELEAWRGNDLNHQYEFTLARKRSLQLDFASYVGDDIFLGIEFSIINRKFLHTMFSQGDLAIQPNREVGALDLNQYLLAPALVYSPEDAHYHQELSVKLEGFGFSDQDYPDSELRPTVVGGYAFSPFAARESWTFGVFQSQTLGDAVSFRKFGGVISYARRDWSLGVSASRYLQSLQWALTLDRFRGAVTYSRIQTPPEQISSASRASDKFALELGINF